jgi:hypothetical protein
MSWWWTSRKEFARQHRHSSYDCGAGFMSTEPSKGKGSFVDGDLFVMSEAAVSDAIIL